MISRFLDWVFLRNFERFITKYIKNHKKNSLKIYTNILLIFSVLKFKIFKSKILTFR